MRRRRKARITSHICGFELIGGKRCQRLVKTDNPNAYCHQHASIPAAMSPSETMWLLDEAAQQAILANTWDEIDPYASDDYLHTKSGNRRPGYIANTSFVDTILNVAKRCHIDDPDGTTQWMLPPLRAVAKNPHTPPELLTILSRHRDSKVRHNAAGNTGASPELMLELACSDEPAVVNRVAGNASASWEIIGMAISTMAEEHGSKMDDDVMVQIARRSDVEFATANLLVYASTAAAKSQMSVSKFTHPEVLYRLAATSPESRVAIAANPAATEPTLELIAASGSQFGCQQLASREGISVEIMHKLCEHSHPAVRKSIAAHSELPYEVITRCAHDRHTHVRGMIAARSDIPPDIADLLASDEDAHVRLSLAHNDTAPSRCLTLLMLSSDAEARRAAMENMARRAES